jgi:hypothetical protein
MRFSKMGFEDFGPQGLSDEDYASVMNRAVPDGQQPPTATVGDQAAPDPINSTQSPSESTPSPAPSKAPAQPDGVAAQAQTAPTSVDQLPQIDPAPAAEPGAIQPTQPNWQTDENPYYQQTQQLTNVMQAAQMYAQQQQQLAAQAEYQRQEAACQILTDKLPELEPEEQKLAVQAIRQWEATKAQSKLHQTEAELEGAAAFITYQHLEQVKQLTPEESAYMRSIPNANAAKFYAESRAAARAEYQQQLAAERAKWEQSLNQTQAQDRLASGADRVGTGGSAPSSLASATNIEEYWAALDLATG